MGVETSLCGRLLPLRLLFDPDRAQSGAVPLAGTGGAERTERVVAGAAGALVQRGGGECPRLVIRAERAGTEVTVRRGRGAANAAVVPRAFPASCRQEEEGSLFRQAGGLRGSQENAGKGIFIPIMQMTKVFFKIINQLTFLLSLKKNQANELNQV